MVAQGPLEAFVMVRIHVGQPTSKPLFSFWNRIRADAITLVQGSIFKFGISLIA
jgi:hypothetical protein